MRVLPILFNIEMVRAILDGRKTVTRRVLKNLPKDAEYVGQLEDSFDPWDEKDIGKSMFKTSLLPTEKAGCIFINPPYQPGDTLYVRETWWKNGNTYFYKAGCSKGLIDNMYVKWRPSIHMPKEAARIWLKVTDVRVERLQDITEEDAFEEGYEGICPYEHRVRCGDYESMCYVEGDCENPLRLCDKSVPEGFGIEIWNKTIKKPDLDRYGWDANPWVWVVEFERCEKPEK
ncbi:hypothetical protein [[Clostridium] scindens]|uniref:hypothetical protein n=1 Tax=Clostridium scindens (strain JCM 10418 / VPI 12708) TaxID=29347 RepID=UPI002E784BB1|nr:hypothetical protein [[Clostridium] scindens]MEE0647328.1 hypothetical protein [[Clostridium] scindens]